MTGYGLHSRIGTGQHPCKEFALHWDQDHAYIGSQDAKDVQLCIYHCLDDLDICLDYTCIYVNWNLTVRIKNLLWAYLYPGLHIAFMDPVRIVDIPYQFQPWQLLAGSYKRLVFHALCCLMLWLLDVGQIPTWDISGGGRDAIFWVISSDKGNLLVTLSETREQENKSSNRHLHEFLMIYKIRQIGGLQGKEQEGR